MDRRRFLTAAGLAAAWAGVTVRISGCSDDGGGNGGTGPGPDDVEGTIGPFNHGHSVFITGAQIDAGGAVTLMLSCVGHEHALSLTAQQVTDIGNGTQVVKDTDSDGTGHSHTVTFN